MTKNRRAKHDARRVAEAQNIPYTQALRATRGDCGGMTPTNRPLIPGDDVAAAKAHYSAMLESGNPVDEVVYLDEPGGPAKAVGLLEALYRRFAARWYEVMGASASADLGESIWATSEAKGRMVADPLVLRIQGFSMLHEGMPGGDEAMAVADEIRNRVEAIRRSGREIGVLFMDLGVPEQLLTDSNEAREGIRLRYRPTGN